MAASEYKAQFLDENGRSGDLTLHASSDADAAAVVNALAAQSDASWVGLQKIELVTVDDQTYTYYRKSGRPVAGCCVQDQGQLFYAVQSRHQCLKVTIPAVVATLLSPTTKRIGTDPITGVGKLIDEEGVSVSAFARGRYNWGKRKGL